MLLHVSERRRLDYIIDYRQETLIDILLSTTVYC